MKSLRSLCLLKVQSLGQTVPDLSEIPASLARDIRISQLVNSSFISWALVHDGVTSTVSQTALSIQYDGVFWNFQSRSNKFELACCLHCDFVQPDLRDFTIQEEKPAQDWSPFSETSIQLELFNQEKPLNLRMKMSFDMNEEGTRGVILFRRVHDLPRVPFVFISNMVIERSEFGHKKLKCEEFVGRSRYRNTLIETRVPAANAISKPVLPFCSGVAWELVSLLNEAVNEEDPVDFLEDFWKFVAIE
eukprot:GFUD01026876.1.p1 GENE.GFUD01026876.1~~GFUD01026876.1.p1  ORF type:complete len:247 (-),score=49.79 GFUD01026876.1:82-822(-)